MIAHRGFAATAVALALLGGRAAFAQTVNVEIDYMTTAGHSHMPQPAEIAAVVQMFAAHGITLNAVVDEAIPEVPIMMDGPDPNDFFTATGPNSYSLIKQQHFQHLGQAGWHYCVFGHQYQEDGGTTGSSGLALRPGWDLVVTLGAFTGQIGTPWDRAASFAHELGHNLGLNHGGSKDPKDIGPYSPDYASIMSYQFQLRGVRTHMMCLGLTGAYNLFKDLDYSNGRLPDVNEGTLDESIGLGMTPTDWDCNGAIGGIVAHDLDDPNNDGRWCDAAGPPNQWLGDWNDWATVQLFTTTPALMDLPEHHESCITAEQAFRADAASDCAAAQPAPTIEPAIAGQMIWCNSGYVGTETGTGNQPFHTVFAAHAAAPNGSILYLRPGTYSCGVAVLNHAIILTGPGVATLVP